MPISPKKRIAINIMATYGRSLFAMLCGIFSSRWLLMSLGDVDYGLFCLVGGLIAFVAFFNSLLGRAVGRFYAFSLGEVLQFGNIGLTRCQEWFNVAFLIHTIVPIILIIIGYPLGTFAISHWLTIPVDRMESCLWVWNFSCISCFLGMLSVPFVAMYTAKQYIAELTVYSFFSTTINVCFLYYMVTHPGDWLIRYALWTCLISIIPQIIIVLRALYIFPECKFNIQYMLSFTHLKEMVSFVGWQFFGDFGYLIKNQGIVILVNKMFGPIMNTTLGIGFNISGKTSQLTRAMNGAFSPALITAAGENNKLKVLDMAYFSCRFGMFMCLFFALPLSVELEAILKIWLKNPPLLTTETCYVMLIIAVCKATTSGSGIAIDAKGNIKMFYFILGMINILVVPIILISCIILKNSFYNVLIILVVMQIITSILSIFIAEKIIEFSPKKWFVNSILPNISVVILSLSGGLIVRNCLDLSHYRILLSLFSTCSISLISFWFIVLNKSERIIIIKKIENLTKKAKKQ